MYHGGRALYSPPFLLSGCRIAAVRKALRHDLLDDKLPVFFVQRFLGSLGLLQADDISRVPDFLGKAVGCVFHIQIPFFKKFSGQSVNGLSAV